MNGALKVAGYREFTMLAPEVRQVEFSCGVEVTTETYTHAHTQTRRVTTQGELKHGFQVKNLSHRASNRAEQRSVLTRSWGCWSTGFTRWCWTFHTFPAPPITSGKAGHNADVPPCTRKAIRWHCWFKAVLVFTSYVLLVLAYDANNKSLQ